MSDRQQELLRRLHKEEDNFVERKVESEGLSEFRRAIVGFANSAPEGQSAVLFIGVDNQGNLQGVGNTDTLQQKIERTCKNDCYPPIDPGSYFIEAIEENNVKILAVEVQRSKNRPHFAGGAFIRVGSQTINASPQIFEEMILSRTSEVAQILKWKDQYVTLEETFKNDVTSQVYLRPRRCKIVDCNTHYLAVEIAATYETRTISLENIRLSTDPFAHGRLKLTVLAQEDRLDSLLNKLFDIGKNLHEEIGAPPGPNWGSLKNRLTAWLLELESLSAVPEIKYDFWFISTVKSTRQGLQIPQSTVKGYQGVMAGLLTWLENQVNYYRGIAQ